LADRLAGDSTLKKKIPTHFFLRKMCAHILFGASASLIHCMHLVAHKAFLKKKNLDAHKADGLRPCDANRESSKIFVQLHVARHLFH
jgi:hypothetical protein